MPSKKSKSRKDKRYKGQSAAQKSSGTQYGQWTLLGKTRDAIKQLIDQHLSVTRWASQPALWDLIAAHGDLSLLQQRLKTYADDVDSLTAVHGEVAKRHDNRFGDFKSPDDMMESIDIHGLYVELGERIEQLLVPMSLAITEQVEQATVKQRNAASEPTETREPE